jgi:arylsulfatase A-like enzyme
VRLAAAFLLAAFVAPAWIGLGGGADLDVGGHRIAFYHGAAGVIGIAACALLALLPAARGGRLVPRALALGVLCTAAWACWTPGIETEWIRIRTPVRPAVLALLPIAVALLLARGRLAPRGGLVAIAGGGALGAAIAFGVLAADRADLDRRIAAAGADARTPDVIVLLMDTLRADGLGAYGAEPSPSPFLDRLAAASVVFERALTQAPWTAPSVSSLLSSLYPSSFLWDARVVKGHRRFFRLPAGMPWLPDRLREAGYHTAAFVKNPILQGGTRFDRGFQVHEWVRGDTAEDRSAGELVDAVLRWGDAMADHRAAGGRGAFFLYAHFMDPHTQYRPPDAWLPERPYDGPIDGGVRTLEKAAERGPSDEDLARAWELYLAEVAYLDAETERLHDGLAARGLWGDDTIVIVIADHGEQFFEHGEFFHGAVHWENLHVPFLVRGPGLAPRRIPEPVALLDLAPTLLDWLGLEVPDDMEGESLLPRLRGEPREPAVVFSEQVGARDDVRATGPRGALVLGEEPWFETPDGRVLPLDEVPDASRPTMAALEAAHARWHERDHPFFEDRDGEQALEPDADTEDRLRALGYVE